eukprot:3047365-Rhodomonas_salina.1
MYFDQNLGLWMERTPTQQGQVRLHTAAARKQRPKAVYAEHISAVSRNTTACLTFARPSLTWVLHVSRCRMADSDSLSLSLSIGSGAGGHTTEGSCGR